MSDQTSGHWENAIIPGVGIRRVFVPATEREQEMEGRGLLSIDNARTLLGCSRNYILAMSSHGVLRTSTIRGVCYVDALDVHDLAAGRSPSERHQREEQEYRAMWEPMFGDPSGPASDRDPAPVDATAAFLRRYGEGD